jgi:putative two-component system response regulator
MLGRLLEQYGYTCTLAGSAKEARRCLQEKEFALILCDVNMPGESGLDLVRYVLREHHHTAAVMVTGLDNPQLAAAALEIGAYGYILKPFESNEILINVANALRRRRLEIENQAHRERLELTVLERTAALRHAIESLERAEKELRLSREETIQRLAIAAEYRDGATAQHIQRMSHYCSLLAQRCGLDAERCELIRIASPMHDIGKIGVSDAILHKPEALSAEEWRVMQRHPAYGALLLEGSSSPLLKMAREIALTHHERWDGSGYPRGLKGDAIPACGRILAVADVYDALRSQRCYKPAFSHERAVEIILYGDGRSMPEHFDPELLRVFREMHGHFGELHGQYYR